MAEETNYIGVALYKIKLNGTLDGKWSVAKNGSSDGALGTEIASPVEGKSKKLEGTYNVVIKNSNGEEIFSGTLEVQKLQNCSYQLSWKQGGVTKYTGYAVKRKRILAANYWNV